MRTANFFMPGEWEDQNSQLERQRRLADLLQAQAYRMPEGNMVSGHYVAPSVTQYLAQLVKGWAGNKQQRELDQQQKDAYAQRSQMISDAGQGFDSAYNQVDPTQSEQVSEDAQGNTVYGQTPTVQNPQAALSYALTHPESMQNPAIQAMLPQLIKGQMQDPTKSPDPYFQFLSTPKGFATGNARTGQIEYKLDANGQPIVKDTASPELQGEIAGKKAEKQAEWKPNTIIPGVATTDANFARQVNGNQDNAPYSVQLAPGTSPEEAARINKLAADDFAKNGRGGMPGIKIPTKTELKQAEADIEVDTAGRKQKQEGVIKKETNLSGIGTVIDLARNILDGKGSAKPTSSGIGTLWDSAMATIGISAEGASEADQLQAISGVLTAKMPRMEGPQSNFDVENYKIMAGRVGDSTLPLARRKAALKVVEQLWRKYDKEDAKVTSAPAPTTPTPNKIIKYDAQGNRLP